MMRRAGWIRVLLAASAAVCSYTAAWAETRLALVVGNAAYADAPLRTAVNDAALVGETLRQLGFDVSEGRDLDQTTLRRLVRDFAAKIEATEGEITVYMYLAGHGAQAAAQNYFMPTDARILRPGDVAAEALSIEALIRETQNQKVKTRFVVLDAASQFPGAAQAKLSPGLAALTGAPDSLVAASASATEIMPPQTGDYGVYALALTQTMREPGLQPDDIFNRVKLRVHQETKGAVTPVHISMLSQPFVFLERAPDAPAVQPQAVADPRKMAIRDLDPAAAYALVIERDTVKDYREFLAAFPNDPLAKKIRARMVQKREARAWQLAARKRSREALWTYRRHYPRGAHYEEAGYELAELGAPLMPPSGFVVERWDEFEPPAPDEVAYYEEVIAEPMTYRTIVPPPPPAYFMPRSPVYEDMPPPPPPASGPGMLPLIGLGALGAAAILPRIVKRPPPRMTQPVAMPSRPQAAPVVVNPPPVPGARPLMPNQIAPQPGGVVPVPGARPPMPGQIPPAANRGPAGPGAAQPPAGTQVPGRVRPPGSAAETAPSQAAPSQAGPAAPPVQPPRGASQAAPSTGPAAPAPGASAAPQGASPQDRPQIRPQDRPQGRRRVPSDGPPPAAAGQAAQPPAIVRPPAAPGAIVRDVAPPQAPPSSARERIAPPRQAAPRQDAVPRPVPPPAAVAPRPQPPPVVRQPPHVPHPRPWRPRRHGQRRRLWRGRRHPRRWQPRHPLRGLPRRPRARKDVPAACRTIKGRNAADRHAQKSPPRRRAFL